MSASDAQFLQQLRDKYFAMIDNPAAKPETIKSIESQIESTNRVLADQRKLEEESKRFVAAEETKRRQLQLETERARHATAASLTLPSKAEFYLWAARKRRKIRQR